MNIIIPRSTTLSFLTPIKNIYNSYRDISIFFLIYLYKSFSKIILRKLFELFIYFEQTDLHSESFLERNSLPSLLNSVYILVKKTALRSGGQPKTVIYPWGKVCPTLYFVQFKLARLP